MTNLWIDDKQVKVTADYSLRWVEVEGGEAYPVLYHFGKRITRAWRIDMCYDSPEDPYGGNANTA